MNPGCQNQWLNCKKKLIRSEQDQKEGRIHSQKEVEIIFKARFDQ